MADIESKAAHSHPWKISDVVLFPLLFIGLALDWWLGLGFPIWRPLGIAVGVMVIGFGGWMISQSKKDLDEARQPSLPGEPTTAVVTTGLFAWSRNPNYLGAILTGVGGALVCNAPVLLGATLLGAVILEVWMIRPEERYLRYKFGEVYQAYCKKVRRWI